MSTAPNTMTLNPPPDSPIPDVAAAPAPMDAAAATAPIAPAALLQTIIEPPHGWQLVNVRELWQYRELLFFLTWRDVKVRYKQTALGAAWAILQPVMMMVVFTIFFGRLAKLPAGPYLLCAQIPSMLVGPKDDPFIDSCASPDISSPIALVQAQTRTGVIVRAKRGYFLKVRVNDPGKLLPAPNTKDGGNALRISLVNAAGLHQSIPITAQDPGGRTHGIVIPYGSPHSLFIQGAGFALQDSAGRGLDGVTPVSVTASPGGPSQAYVVNVMKAVKP